MLQHNTLACNAFRDAKAQPTTSTVLTLKQGDLAQLAANRHETGRHASANATQGASVLRPIVGAYSRMDSGPRLVEVVLGASHRSQPTRPPSAGPSARDTRLWWRTGPGRPRRPSHVCKPCRIRRATAAFRVPSEASIPRVAPIMWPSCHAIWFDLGTERTSRSASVRSST